MAAVAATAVLALVVEREAAATMGLARGGTAAVGLQCHL